ncbi:MAG TPA: serine/threonine-protein kinase [Pirellulales bacterium]|jgi:serine/threonine protein kinase|nr:serine/threonine-protein kinase [Pirellulales bacterium]
MADSFDPYQEWLGISPFEPPPNHYRLLGLRPFEDSADLIQQTVIRLVARLHGLAAGRPEALTRRIFADLAAARDTLTNPEAKRAYDRALRDQLANGPSTGDEKTASGLHENTIAERENSGGDEAADSVIFQAAEDPRDAGTPSTIASRSTLAPAPGETPKPAKAKRIGDYVILERIGVGGMGQVFKAQQRKLKRIVAIKVLPPQWIKSIESVRRFYREVESAARLNHPNIVVAFDAGEQNGIHYLVMEFVDGKDLSQVLKQDGPLPITNVIDYVRQAATGLAYAHREGIIHRDIKPANLLVNQEGQVKILDMGLASNKSSITAGDDAKRGAATGGPIMGTVDYMSPEQAEDTQQADARSDIYSLGCTMYRLLTNDLMYKGETNAKKIQSHRAGPIPTLRALRPEAPAWLDQVFQRMVAKQPAARFQSMEELAQALNEGQQTGEVKGVLVAPSTPPSLPPPRPLPSSLPPPLPVALPAPAASSSTAVPPPLPATTAPRTDSNAAVPPALPEKRAAVAPAPLASADLPPDAPPGAGTASQATLPEFLMTFQEPETSAAPLQLSPPKPAPPRPAPPKAAAPMPAPAIPAPPRSPNQRSAPPVAPPSPAPPPRPAPAAVPVAAKSAATKFAGPPVSVNPDSGAPATQPASSPRGLLWFGVVAGALILALAALIVIKLASL